MKYMFLNIKMNGIKCIDQEVEIQFANKTIDKDIFNHPHVKAIYGTNGTGKSSIIHGLSLYRHSVTDPEYLLIESRNGNLKEIINQNTKKAYIDVYFAENMNSAPPLIVHHYIEYKLDDNNSVYVSKEIASLVKNNRWGDINNETPIYEVTEGEITYFNEKMEPVKEEIVQRTLNLLKRTSLSPLLFSADLHKKINDNDGKLYYLAANRIFAYSIFLMVYIDEKDVHKMSLQKANYILEKTKALSLEKLPARYEFAIDYEIDDIDMNQLEEYKKEVKKIEKFLKIFKPQLDSIEIDPSPIGNKYRCKKILVYKNGTRISSEYESNGIKKLMKLFPYLNAVESLGPVFIDEFDSNIHDVYLCKLIEYFIDYTKGQFVFTTHNLGPMEVLDNSDLKHSIDFINDSKISSWKRNGNYSVVNLYRNGAIPNCPFNIDSSDFVKTFGAK